MATSVIKPNNAGVDLPIDLPTTGWSSNQWTYSNSAITADCTIEVEFKAGTLNDNVPYIEYEKASGGGGIVFTVPTIPTVAIPIIAHVYYTQAGAFTMANATDITTSGDSQTLGSNVNVALVSLNSNLNKVSMAADIVVSNIAGVKAKLLEIAGTIANGESRLVRIVHTNNSETDIMRPHARYEGLLCNNYLGGISWLASDMYGNVVIFSYETATQYWTTEKLALNSKFTSQIVTISPDSNGQFIMDIDYSTFVSMSCSDASNYLCFIRKSASNKCVVFSYNDGMNKITSGSYNARVWTRVP